MGYGDEKFEKLDSKNVEACHHIQDVWCQKFSDRARLIIDDERLRRDAEHEGRKLEGWQDQLLKHLCWTRSDIRIQFAQRHYLQTPCTSNERNARRHSPPPGRFGGWLAARVARRKKKTQAGVTGG